MIKRYISSLRETPPVRYSDLSRGMVNVTTVRSATGVRDINENRKTGRYAFPMTYLKDGRLYAGYEIVIENVIPPKRPSPTPSPRGGVWDIPKITDVLWHDRDLRTWLGDTPVHLLFSLLTDRNGLLTAIECHAIAWASHKGAEVAETGLGPSANPNLNGMAVAAGTVVLTKLLRGS